MAFKDGIVGDIVMWGFLGAAGVLVLTHIQSFDSGFNTAVQPLEFETGMIATAGGSLTSSKK